MKKFDKKILKKITNKTKLINLFGPYLKKGDTLTVAQIALEIGLSKEDPVLLLTAAQIISNYTAAFEVAITLYEKAISCFPDVKNNREIASLKAQIKIELAAQLMLVGQEKKSLSLYMDVAQNFEELKLKVGESLLIALLQVGHLELALKISQAWLSEQILSADFYANIGNMLRMLNRSSEALPFHQKAIEMDPNNRVATFYYGISLLKKGDYKEGFKFFADHDSFASNPDFWFVKDIPFLTAETEVKGKNILFFQEQGLGDTLQFSRFIPHFLKQGAHVTLAVPKSLKRLLSLSFPDVTVLVDGDLGKDRPDRYQFDFAYPIPDISYICKVETPLDVPNHIPYLRASEEDVKRFSTLIADILPPRSDSQPWPLRIGIVWGGERRQKAVDVASDKRRSTNFKEMITALAPVKADIFNLQFGTKRSELKAEDYWPQPVYDLMDEIHDMADTAALMENLDLIISVDTSPLHLSAALGRPTWLVNRWDSCWRWGDKGDTSVWYPTVRIFRAKEKSFVPVLNEVGEALRTLVSS